MRALAAGRGADVVLDAGTGTLDLTARCVRRGGPVMLERQPVVFGMVTAIVDPGGRL